MTRTAELDALVVEIPEVSDAERAAGVAANAEFEKNVAWWNANVKAVGPRHVGEFVCVAGQELFAGDDSAEVMARAKAAHPDPGDGFLCFRIPTHSGPMIHVRRR